MKERDSLVTDQTTLNIKPGLLTAAQIERDREITVAREAESVKLWEGMDADQKAAIKYIVERSLERALDKIDTWLPGAVTLDSIGQYMDLTVRIIFSDLQTEQEARQELTQRQIRQAALGTLSMIKEEQGGNDNAAS